ncbi:unnamed protein product [Blepharisma stoltei]|uniref:Uncharacterized protein n=1 Tax=Blepharisma stoltei TaxID=1481888 RepID=A0AAU9JPN2_9CILI|nr:unnamed protein product [Blepharisma stoltei]
MEFRSMTQKQYVNWMFWLGFLLAMAYVVFTMLESSMSCIDADGCLKTWCEMDWLESEVQDKIRQNDCILLNK